VGEMICSGLSLRRDSFSLDIDELHITQGEKIALLGENGCGKTTLLRVLAGLQPCEGNISCNEKNWFALSARQRAEYLSYLPQEASVLFNLTVGELIGLSLDTEEIITADEQQKVLVAVEMDTFLDRSFHSLSGGEKRRAMLARILSRRTPFLFMDEPTAPLDMRHAAQVMHYVAGTSRTIVAAVHDLILAQRYFNRFLLMKHGRILFDKRKDELAAPELEKIYGIRLRDCGDHFIPDDECPCH